MSKKKLKRKVKRLKKDLKKLERLLNYWFNDYQDLDSFVHAFAEKHNIEFCLEHESPSQNLIDTLNKIINSSERTITKI